MDTGCRRLPVEGHMHLPGDGRSQLAEEGNRCRLGMQLEVDRSQQCRVVAVRSHDRTHRVCKVRCIHRRGLHPGQFPCFGKNFNCLYSRRSSLALRLRSLFLLYA